MQLPLDVSPERPVPLQRQLFDEVRRLIVAGLLAPHTPMPSTRGLAEQLGVSRTTVVQTYGRLVDEGYLVARRAAGTFVRADPPPTSAHTTMPAAYRSTRLAWSPSAHAMRVGRGGPGLFRPAAPRIEIDFRVGVGDARLFPQRAWKRIGGRCLAAAGRSLTRYGDPRGLPALREQIARFLGAARGMEVRPDDVLVVAGLQQGLDLVGRVLVRRGDRVVVESPGYRGAARAFEAHGAALAPVRVDSEGLDVTRLPQGVSRLVCVTPSHQSPMGGTLGMGRRRELLAWAYRVGSYVAEVDYAGDFRYDGSPLPAIHSLDPHGQVVYLGSFSTSIGPALRLGYLVVPRALADEFVMHKALLDNGCPWLDQAILAEFMAGDGYERHLRRLRRAQRARRDALVAALRHAFGPAMLDGLEGGMHLAWTLPDALPPALEVESRARDRGVGVYSLNDDQVHPLPLGRAWSRVLLLGYAALDPAAIREGVSRLAAALRSTRAAALAASRSDARL
jgi:GntR family transcriptional regulator/MocR family aminotransferase